MSRLTTPGVQPMSRPARRLGEACIDGGKAGRSEGRGDYDLLDGEGRRIEPQRFADDDTGSNQGIQCGRAARGSKVEAGVRQ